jgi:hypothetical protein
MARECPNADHHETGPEGYIHWHAWAEEKTKTHKQRKCPDCGLWLLWEAT